MNREIKYRAWHKRYKEFYEVTCIDWEAKFVWVKYYDDDREEWFSREEHFADVELMQYTGLKDEDGKEIFERDCLSVISFEDNHEYKGHVVFDKGTFCLKVLMRGRKYKVPFYSFSEIDANAILEVIGNIFSNPELLEETK